MTMMMVVRWLGWNRPRVAAGTPARAGPWPRRPSVSPRSGADQGRLAWLIQNRVAGMASRRAGLDHDATDLTATVTTGLEAIEGPSHLAKRLPQLDSQDLGLAPFGRDLAGIGEVGVVGQAARRPRNRARRARRELPLLVLEELTVVDGWGVTDTEAHGDVPYLGMGPFPGPHRSSPAGGPSRRPGANGPGSPWCRSAWS